MDKLDECWRTSSRSGTNGQCVEARFSRGLAEVRDTKDRTGPMLSFAPDTWTAFVEGVKAGLFDH